MDKFIAATETPDHQEQRIRRLQAEQAAAEQRLGELAKAALALPDHLIDEAVNQAWNDAIVDDVDLSCVLSEWIDELLTADPAFLRHVFESWKRWLS